MSKYTKKELLVIAKELSRMEPKLKPKVYLKPHELAERLEMSTGALANWRVKGMGPKFLSAPVRYPIKEIEKWEAKSLISSTSARK